MTMLLSMEAEINSLNKINSTIMKKKLSIKSGSSHFKNAALMFLFSIIGMTSYSQSLTFDLTNGADFSFLSTNRTLLSGTQNAAGSVYKYSNLVTIGTTTIYGKLTIIATPNASIVTFDDNTSNPSWFQPIITTTGSGHVEYKLEFFDTATNFPVYLKNYYLNVMNLDGNATIREKILLQREEFTTFTLSQQFPLVHNIPGGNSGLETLFLGLSQNVVGDPGFYDKSSFYAYYNVAKTSVGFKIGANEALTGRRVALSFGNKQAFTNPSQTTANYDTANFRANMLVDSHTVNNPVVAINENVNFTTTIQNQGATGPVATNVIVGHKLPSGYTYVSHNAPAGTTYDPVTGIWLIGNLVSGGGQGSFRTLVVTAKVNPTGLYESSVFVSSDLADNVASNNSGSVTVTPQFPFDDCSPGLFLTQYGTSTTLYGLDITESPIDIDALGVANGVKINAVGYNPIDNYIYGIRTSDGFTNNDLYRIGKDNIVARLGSIPDLPDETYFAGDIDNLGNYYVKYHGNFLIKINIANKTFTKIPLSTSVSTFDIAYNIKDSLIYCVSLSGARELLTINPLNGTVTTIGATGIGDAFGAMFTDGITGAVYGNSNGVSNFSAKFYKFNTNIDINTNTQIPLGRATAISPSIATAGNDGAHCVNAGIPLLVDLAITKTNNQTVYVPGTTVTYTIVASNSGPFTAISALVKDVVPTGIAAANMTYTAIASEGSDTSVTGTKTGSINDFVNIQVGGTITYTVSLVVPLSYTGNLVNLATITKSTDNIENNLSNNSATDTDTKCPAATITTQPLFTQTVTKNDPTTQLSVVASGTSVTYQWYKNTSNSTTGGTLIASATSASYTPLSTVVGQTYYYVQVISPCGSLFSTTSLVKVNEIVCYKNPETDNTSGTIYDTRIGISALNRAGVASTWPGVRKSGWMVLEAKTKGFVLNRVKFNASSQPVADDGTTLVITNPIEGMMVFDTTNNCLKVYTTTNGTNFAWYCMETQTCPE